LKAVLRSLRDICTVAAVVATLGVAALPGSAMAQAYPTKAIRLVVPFPPGGFSDIYARVLSTEMAKTFGQAVVVDNKPGAGGNIASDMVAKSAPDGYTLVMGTIGTHAINATLFPNLSYDPIKDFAPVAFVVDAEGLLVVNPDVPVQTVGDLIKLAKASPAKLNYASAGMGSTGHLAAEIFKTATHTDITHVAYKGNVPAIQDLLAGQVQVSFATLPTVLPQVKAGKLRPIAVLGLNRSATMPQIPTVAESGVPGFEASNWTGMFAPAGTPPAIVEKLNAEVQRIMKLPDVQARMAEGGLLYQPMTVAQFSGFVKSEVAKWGAVVKQTGAKAE